MQLLGMFPSQMHAELRGLLSVAFPEVSYPNGPAMAGRLQLSCHEHMPGAGEHKRMEISTAFVSAIEVMMTIHCCRCVHIEYVFFII